MRRAIVFGFLLLVGLAKFAFATDYELTVDTSPKSLTSAKTLTVYEPYGLIKPGDRIVKLMASKLPTPNIACKIYVGSGENSTVVAQHGSVRAFPGEIRLGHGNPSGTVYAGALLMHVV